MMFNKKGKKVTQVVMWVVALFVIVSMIMLYFPIFS
jgi:hypothetical protein